MPFLGPRMNLQIDAVQTSVRKLHNVYLMFTGVVHNCAYTQSSIAKIVYANLMETLINILTIRILYPYCMSN